MYLHKYLNITFQMETKAEGQIDKRKIKHKKKTFVTYNDVHSQKKLNRAFYALYQVNVCVLILI